jgi:hypothetical protein
MGFYYLKGFTQGSGRRRHRPRDLAAAGLAIWLVAGLPICTSMPQIGHIGAGCDRRGSATSGQDAIKSHVVHGKQPMHAYMLLPGCISLHLADAHARRAYAESLR